MFFNVAKKSHLLQEMVISILTGIHPSIEHNIDKVKMLKRAFFHCELEKLEGAYFEFGIYEGTSLYSALKNYEKLNSPIERNFFGFDSFDDGFKHFDERDKHPFFQEGDFTSSYKKVKKRFQHYKHVFLIKGYFENVLVGKDVREMYPGEKCAVVFIDCDLMGPAKIALDYVKPILQPGTVIILDDYWAYKANPNRGTAGALSMFLEENKNIRVREYYTYGHGGNSFVVTHVE